MTRKPVKCWACDGCGREKDWFDRPDWECKQCQGTGWAVVHRSKPENDARA